MVDVPFDVNSESTRTGFLVVGLFAALGQLSADHKPRWGNMAPQQMVEHLIWAMEISNGLVAVECRLPSKLVERFKEFLYSEMPTSREFMNPVLKKGLPPLRLTTISQAVAALREQTNIFLEHKLPNWNEPKVHPVFGPLNHEEWSRAHFKHYYHHLLQFGLLSSNQ